MSKRERLYKRISNSQHNVRFQDFCMLLVYFGFRLVRTRGSHHLYQHRELEEVMNVQPMKDNQAKAYQVRQFLKLVETHHLSLTPETEDESDET